MNEKTTRRKKEETKGKDKGRHARKERKWKLREEKERKIG